MRGPVVALTCWLAMTGGAAAQQPTQRTTDLLLALAVDASGSVNQERFVLQMQGYAAAFRNPRVLNAIQSGATQSIAVSMYQWTGYSMQSLVIPWTLLKDKASSDAFAAAIDAVPRRLFGGGTSISGAIDFGKLLFPLSEYTATRRTIDVSGDGSNNRGRNVTQARDEAVNDGININGLPITALDPWLEDYYRSNVIGGPGSFAIAAKSYEHFAEAVLKKLILEIASNDR